MLNWLSRITLVDHLGDAVRCKVFALPNDFGAMRRFAATPRGTKSGPGHYLVVAATLKPATPQDLSSLAEMASCCVHKPYAAVLMSPRVSRTMRSRVEAMNRPSNSGEPFFWAVELAVSEKDGSYIPRLRLVAGHDFLPKLPQKRSSAEHVGFWLQVEEDLAASGLPATYVREDCTGLVVALGRARSGVTVIARMYKGEPAAIVRVRLAGKASQNLFDHLERAQKHSRTISCSARSALRAAN